MKDNWYLNEHSTLNVDSVVELSLLEDLIFPVLREILSTKGGDGNGKFFVSCGH